MVDLGNKPLLVVPSVPSLDFFDVFDGHERHLLANLLRGKARVDTSIKA